MTKEEAKKILACRGNGYSEEDFNDAIEVAFNCIPSLPSNLDEAADAYIRRVVDATGHPGRNWETQDIADAFIAGAKWIEEQGVSIDASVCKSK